MSCIQGLWSHPRCLLSPADAICVFQVWSRIVKELCSARIWEARIPSRCGGGVPSHLGSIPPTSILIACQALSVSECGRANPIIALLIIGSTGCACCMSLKAWYNLLSICSTCFLQSYRVPMCAEQQRKQCAFVSAFPGENPLALQPLHPPLTACAL